MTMAATLIVGIVVGTFGAGVLGAQAASGDDAPIVEEELQRQPLMSADGMQGMLVRARLAPGAAMADEPNIEHPAEEFVYVVEGTATLTREGDAPLEFEAGDSWYNPSERAHTLANASSSEPLTVVAILIGDEEAF